ncbi:MULTISPECIES: iron ABC transporter permease [unclassified Paenibacillus]|uniref:FecCD family ABC transporter permease n=1 Tax=unclassified Paenibacillus TaxID=185978 RepID=UPI00095491B7|nr:MULTISPECIES: iron ABC transporter permease [unclassified Paenibacillus]ASS67813.1 iron ABC transporter permease [Paenibacillus sp. RUD330]SIR60192.1 iron complex transport system permease protein [Paenibacillus sp. RU4X]SIR69052.1 iron complex transport system permease protein [Paenibacillus sp. RU4T]
MRTYPRLPAVILLITPAAALCLVLLSALFGAKSIHAVDVWNAVAHFDPDNVNHQIIRHSRLPRVFGSLLIGAFLAVSGAVMQGITRNALASPSMLGVSDGSVFVVTLCMVFLPQLSSTELIAMSMAGSALGAALVFGMAWLIPGGGSPVKLAILGTLAGMFLNGVADAVAMYAHIPQKISFWYNARLHQLDPELITLALPFAAAGLILALVLARSISALSLGEEMSVSLGQRVRLIKGLSMLAVVLLTGTSVALAGKIAFVGLIVPHVARMLAGTDYRRIIPVSGVLGALFLAACDILSRFLNAPFETPIGVVTALFGVPFFLYLVKKKGGAAHA